MKNAKDIADADITIFVDSAKAKASLADCAQRVFQAARYFGTSIGTSKGTRGGLFVTVGWRPSALRGGLAALARTVALEYPGCSTKAIEMEPEFRPSAEPRKQSQTKFFKVTRRRRLCFAGTEAG